MRLASLLLAALAAAPAAAEPALVLNHTGRILDEEDKGLTGQADMEFELHTAPAPGGVDEVVWSDSFPSVPLGPGGTYTLLLGDTSTASGSGHHALTAAEFAGDRWLAIKVNGQALTPWLRIGAVAHALLAARATDADAIGGESLTELDARYLAASAASGFVPLTAGGISVAGDITTTAGRFAGDGSGLTDLDATELFGPVPAGSLPTDLARTSGGVTFQGNVTAANQGKFFGDGSALTGIRTGFGPGGEAAGADRTLGNADAKALGFLTDGTTRLHIDKDGNVGIGTTDPQMLLDVNGGLRIGSTEDCTNDNSGTLRFKANKLEICIAPNWNPISTAVTIESDGAGGRRWNDGTYAASCNGYRNPPPGFVSGTGDGVYTIKPASIVSPFKVYCDMTSENVGWTLVARGFGGSNTGWATTGDLNLANSTSISGTFKFADATINAIPRTHFRYAGDGCVVQDWFWKGTCVYGHTTASAGDCNLSFPTSDLTTGGQQGTYIGGHMGLGDWDGTRDWLHTSHSSHYWLIRKPLNGNFTGDCVNACYSAQTNCNVTLWVK